MEKITEVRSFRDVIDLWASEGPYGARRAFADDIGFDRNTVRGWYHRDTIPPEAWEIVIRKARKFETSVTFTILHRLHQQRFAKAS